MGTQGAQALPLDWMGTQTAGKFPRTDSQIECDTKSLVEVVPTIKERREPPVSPGELRSLKAPAFLCHLTLRVLLPAQWIENTE